MVRPRCRQHPDAAGSWRRDRRVDPAGDGQDDSLCAEGGSKTMSRWSAHGVGAALNTELGNAASWRHRAGISPAVRKGQSEGLELAMPCGLLPTVWKSSAGDDEAVAENDVQRL